MGTRHARRIDGHPARSVREPPSRRPADIARALRLSRLAVHATIASLVEAGFFALEPGPDDGRIKVVALTDLGWRMFQDANVIVERLAAALEQRIGKRRVRALREVFEIEWGEPPVIPIERWAQSVSRKSIAEKS